VPWLDKVIQTYLEMLRQQEQDGKARHQQSKEQQQHSMEPGTNQNASS
jgi:hypothetical protein